jgi:hypothetical protein
VQGEGGLRSGLLHETVQRNDMNRKIDRWSTRRIVACLVCMFLTRVAAGQTSPGAAPPQMRRQSVPVAAEIERSPMRTGLYLQVETRWFGVPLNKFSASVPDESERACAAALEDIRTKNYAHFKNIWEIPPKPANGASSSGLQGDSNVWLDAYHSNFDFDHVTMVAEVLVGSHSVCLWDAHANATPVRRAFIVRGRKGEAKVSAVTSFTKLEEVILESFAAALDDPPKYKPAFDFHLRVQLAIPSEADGAVGEHPVFLQFDGAPTDDDMAQKTPLLTSDPLIQFYQRAYLANSGPSLDAVTPLFTPKSATDWKNWTEQKQGTDQDPAKGQEKKGALRAEQAYLSPRYVKFVIHGDPVSLIFISSQQGKNWNPDLVSYRYVVKDPGSGQFQFANFTYVNGLDQFLYSKLFDMKALRTAPSKEKPAAARAGSKTGK